MRICWLLDALDWYCSRQSSVTRIWIQWSPRLHRMRACLERILLEFPDSHKSSELSYNRFRSSLIHSSPIAHAQNKNIMRAIASTRVHNLNTAFSKHLSLTLLYFWTTWFCKLNASSYVAPRLLCIFLPDLACVEENS